MISTLRPLYRLRTGKPDPLTEEEFDEMLDDVRALNLPDVRI